MRNLRAAALAAIMLFAPALSEAQTVTPLNTLVFRPDCANRIHPPAVRFQLYNGDGGVWPLMQIYDGTTRATVNPNGGINVNLPGGTVGVTGTFFQATQPVSAPPCHYSSERRNGGHPGSDGGGHERNQRAGGSRRHCGVAMPTNITQIGDKCCSRPMSGQHAQRGQDQPRHPERRRSSPGHRGRTPSFCSISFPPQAAAITATVIEGTGTNCTTITEPRAFWALARQPPRQASASRQMAVSSKATARHG